MLVYCNRANLDISVLLIFPRCFLIFPISPLFTLCACPFYTFLNEKKKYYLKKKSGNQLCVRNMHHFV